MLEINATSKFKKDRKLRCLEGMPHSPGLATHIPHMPFLLPMKLSACNSYKNCYM